MAWALGTLYWAWTMVDSYGIAAGDGGVLRPLAERLAMAGGMVLVGILPFLGFVMFAALYLVRAERKGDVVTVSTTGLFRPVHRRHCISESGSATEYPGRLALRSTVNAPWLSLRVAGKWLQHAALSTRVQPSRHRRRRPEHCSGVCRRRGECCAQGRRMVRRQIDRRHG